MMALIIKKMIVYTGSFHHFFNDGSDNLHLIISFSSLNSSDLESEEFNDENAMKRKKESPLYCKTRLHTLVRKRAACSAER